MRTRQSATFTFFLCLCCFLALPAFAETRDFGDFTIELPAGWTVEREGITVAFVAEDKSANLQVTVEPVVRLFREGITARELAEAYADELKGTVPEVDEEDPNYYAFNFTSPYDGQNAEASIVVAGRRFYLITVTGKHPDMAGMVESVLLSIQ